jgi:hypothetical protein
MPRRSGSCAAFLKQKLAVAEQGQGGSSLAPAPAPAPVLAQAAVVGAPATVFLVRTRIHQASGAATEARSAANAGITFVCELG